MSTVLEPQDPAMAWERIKEFYDEWFSKNGDKAEEIYGINDCYLLATDLAFLLAVAAGKPDERAQALDLLSNAVDGWRNANARQLEIINRLQARTIELEDQLVVQESV